MAFSRYDGNPCRGKGNRVERVLTETHREHNNRYGAKSKGMRECKENRYRDRGLTQPWSMDMAMFLELVVVGLFDHFSTDGLAMLVMEKIITTQIIFA